MPALDWQTRRDALTGAIGSATGADLSVATNVRDALSTYGALYTSAFTVPVSTEKAAGDAAFATALSAWESATTAKHSSAVRACRYVESLIGAAGPTLAFSSTDSSPVITRIDATKAKVEANGTLPETTVKLSTNLLATHRGSIQDAYLKRPKPSYGPAYAAVGVLDQLHGFSGFLGTVIAPPRAFGKFSVLQYEERVIGPLIDVADRVLAELAFV
jgi:hypothetical protein